MKKVIFGLICVLILLSAVEFLNPGIGKNFSFLYMLLGLLMLYVAYRSRKNPEELWSIAGIALVVYSDAVINLLFKGTGSLDIFFFAYMLLFGACFVVSIMLLRKERVKLKLNSTQLIIFVSLSILLILLWYQIM